MAVLVDEHGGLELKYTYGMLSRMNADACGSGSERLGEVRMDAT